MVKQKIRAIFPLILSLVMFITALGIGTSSTEAAAPTGDSVVSLAKKLVGKPYKKGAVGPTSFDSYGLTKYVYNQVGISLKSSLSGQAYQGTYIAKGKTLQKGDLVFFGKSTTQLLDVGIYIGNNQFIDAYSKTGKVTVKSMKGDYKTYYLGARRVLDSKSSTNTGSTSGSTISAKASNVSKIAQSYLGVPYRLGAKYDRDGSYKFDCASFTQKVFSRVGISIPGTAIPQYNATKARSVSKSNAQVGDLVFFDLNDNGGIDHVGIYLGNGKVIHASTANGGKVQITDVAKSSWWNKRWIKTTRVL